MAYWNDQDQRGPASAHERASQMPILRATSPPSQADKQDSEETASAMDTSSFLRGSQVGGAGPYALRRNITLTSKSPETVRKSRTRRLDQSRESGHAESEEDTLLMTPTAPRPATRRPLAVNDGVFLSSSSNAVPQAPKKRSSRPTQTKTTKIVASLVGSSHTNVHLSNQPSGTSVGNHEPSLPPSQGSSLGPPPPLTIFQRSQIYSRPADNPPNGYVTKENDSICLPPPAHSTSSTRVDVASKPYHLSSAGHLGSYGLQTPPQYRPLPKVNHPPRPPSAGPASVLEGDSFAPVHSPPRKENPAWSTAQLSDALFPTPSPLVQTQLQKKKVPTFHRQRSVPLPSEQSHLGDNTNRATSVPPAGCDDEASAAHHRDLVAKLKSIPRTPDSTKGAGSTVPTNPQLAGTSRLTLTPIHEDLGPGEGDLHDRNEEERDEKRTQQLDGELGGETFENEAQMEGWNEQAVAWDNQMDMEHEGQRPHAISPPGQDLTALDGQNQALRQSMPGTMGRPTGNQARIMQQGFDRIEEQFASLAAELGYPVNRVKNVWTQRFRMLTTKPRGGNGVNHYNLYGQLWGNPDKKQREINRALEHRATLTEKEKTGLEKEPTRSECYSVYRLHHQEELWKEILQLEVAELECKERETVTLQTRKINFESTKASLCNLMDNASRLHEFEAVLILSGSHHSDKNLVYVYETAGAQGFVEDRLRTTPSNLGIRLQVHASDALEKKKPFTLFDDELKKPDDTFNPEGEQSGMGGIASSKGVAATGKGGKPGKPSKRKTEEEEEDDDDDVDTSSKSISDEVFAQMGSKELHAVIKDHLSSEICKLPEFAREKPWKVLHWRRLPTYLAKRGLTLTKWNPRAKVPVNTDQTGKGIREAGAECSRFLANDVRHGRGLKPVKSNSADIRTSVLPVIVFRPPRIASRPAARGTRVFLDGSVDQLGPCSLDSDDYIGPPRTAITTPKTSVAAASATAKPKPAKGKPPTSSEVPKEKAAARKGTKRAKSDKAPAKKKSNTKQKGASKAASSSKHTAKMPAKRKQVGGGGDAADGSSSSVESTDSEDTESGIDLPRRTTRNGGRRYKSNLFVSTSDDESSASDSDDDDYEASVGGVVKATTRKDHVSDGSDVDEQDDEDQVLVQAEEGRAGMGGMGPAQIAPQTQSSLALKTTLTAPSTGPKPSPIVTPSPSTLADGLRPCAVTSVPCAPPKRPAEGRPEGETNAKKPRGGTNVAPAVQVLPPVPPSQDDSSPQGSRTGASDAPPLPSHPPRDLNSSNSFPSGPWGSSASFPESGEGRPFKGTTTVSQGQLPPGPPPLPHPSHLSQVSQHSHHPVRVPHHHRHPHQAAYSLPNQNGQLSLPQPPPHVYSDWGPPQQQQRNQEAWLQASYGQHWDGSQPYPPPQDTYSDAQWHYNGTQAPANAASTQRPTMQEYVDTRYPPSYTPNNYPPSYQSEFGHQPAPYNPQCYDQFNSGYSRQSETTYMSTRPHGQHPPSGVQGR
ncbi:hypothetical protein CC1G_03487 [Coprinopsis cinerea okayama7|uniref:Uncharacterized protein n=1 Tax=Coprinopsis cinerea (strain Okayama-7 / 130 / ATCC MYA-4618 / FGSC 9003) TaxID=240176 RepID=A8NCC9_COPC7|nr:hypothetical protein CC1G_03487 [Coprinopsis cinerea okayama7\|eukprot:XP_001832473.2 hypothetical protein CC1G_03487 [Coprinopsis cinerea okayama7\